MSNATASNEMTEEQAAALLAELEGGETETETEEFEASEQDLEIATASLEEVPESEGDEDDDCLLYTSPSPRDRG